MEYSVYRLSAFPKEPHGGNPAGVVVNADLLNENDMQEIAKRIGYSETAFVSKSTNADFLLRFFTPLSEVALCGHATIATFNLLRDLNMIEEGFYTQETKVGILKLEVKKDMVYMEQVPPIYGEFIDPIEIKNCFSDNNFINKLYPIRILSTGMKEIFVPIQTVDLLHNITPIMNNIIKISEKYDVIGVHCFALSNEKNIDAYGRNFAPIVGIDEESATGTSNGALGCYINNYIDKNKIDLILRQGYSMNMPSEIITKLKIVDEEVITVFVGGRAIRIEE